jgi:hypothetical protein
MRAKLCGRKKNRAQGGDQDGKPAHKADVSCVLSSVIRVFMLGTRRVHGWRSEGRTRRTSRWNFNSGGIYSPPRRRNSACQGTRVGGPSLRTRRAERIFPSAELCILKRRASDSKIPRSLLACSSFSLESWSRETRVARANIRVPSPGSRPVRGERIEDGRPEPQQRVRDQTPRGRNCRFSTK